MYRKVDQYITKRGPNQTRGFVGLIKTWFLVSNSVHNLDYDGRGDDGDEGGGRQPRATRRTATLVAGWLRYLRYGQLR